MQREIADRERQLQELKDKYRGRGGGRYPGSDGVLKKRLDAELKELRDGILPGERQRPPQVLEGAALSALRSSEATQGRVAYPKHPPAGR
jgi:hypothetical protein